MSRALSKVGKRHHEVIDVMAHAHVAANMASQVEGFEDFFEHYLEHGLTAHQRRLWQAFIDRVPEVREEMARLLQQSQYVPSDTGG